MHHRGSAVHKTKPLELEKPKGINAIKMLPKSQS